MPSDEQSAGSPGVTTSVEVGPTPVPSVGGLLGRWPGRWGAVGGCRLRREGGLRRQRDGRAWSMTQPLAALATRGGRRCGRGRVGGDPRDRVVGVASRDSAQAVDRPRRGRPRRAAVVARSSPSGHHPSSIGAARRSDAGHPRRRGSYTAAPCRASAPMLLTALAIVALERRWRWPASSATAIGGGPTEINRRPTRRPEEGRHRRSPRSDDLDASTYRRRRRPRHRHRHRRSTTTTTIDPDVVAHAFPVDPAVNSSFTPEAHANYRATDIFASSVAGRRCSHRSRARSTRSDQHVGS